MLQYLLKRSILLAMKAVYSIIGFFVFIVFIIVAISLSGNLSNQTSVAPNAKTTVKLADYSNSTSEVVLTIAGPVTADEKHYSVRMRVNGGLRSVELIKGYQGTVEKSKTYQNNASAYDAFLKALDGAAYSAERDASKDAQNNESSACYSGNKYSLDLNTPSNVVFHRWTSSCYGIRGTFGGDISKIMELFKNQMPDYSEVAGNSGIY